MVKPHWCLSNSELHYNQVTNNISLLNYIQLHAGCVSSLDGILSTPCDSTCRKLMLMKEIASTSISEVVKSLDKIDWQSQLHPSPSGTHHSKTLFENVYYHPSPCYLSTIPSLGKITRNQNIPFVKQEGYECCVNANFKFKRLILIS